MNREVLQVRMLGKFTLSYAGKQISCSNNRSRLIWNILAYLLCHRGKFVSAEELIPVIWRQEKNDNPAGAMRTAIHRVRAMLNELSEAVSAQLLISKNGGYMWNPEVEMMIDAEEFERLAVSAGSDNAALEVGLTALKLYDGKFLPMQSSEMWVMPIQTYYHSLYEALLDKIMPALEQEGRFGEGIALCNKAVQIDPYSEKIYQSLMRFLLMTGDRQEVIQVYEKMSQLLLETFGIMPDQESRSLYREALNLVNNSSVLAPEAIQELLCEPGEINGALICDIDFFKMLYQAQARTIVRSGQVIHIALLSLKSRGPREASPKSVSLAMDNLERHLSKALRKGDTITRCSVSQFLVMLPASNYENSCKVCRRFVSSFERKYPHSPVYVDFYVQALVPSTYS